MISLPSPADFRPISITPVLSRLLKCLTVHTYIYPIFTQPPMDHLLSDHNAFRPTGSTTAALVSVLQQTPSLLTSELYVALISLDFTKAFDTVRHSELARKLALLDIPDEIYNLVVSFLKDCSHVTRFAGRLSAVAHINASVVQGSGFGPSSFDILASDLHPLHQRNSIAKYADDTYLIVPASARSSVRMELHVDHISSWAKLNNLRLNKTKSRELLIHGRRSFQPPPHLTDIERVTTMKVLGVTLMISTHRRTSRRFSQNAPFHVCTPHIT